LLGVGARGQHIIAPFGQSRKNLGQMISSFPLPEDDLGHTGAQCAMMVYLRKPQVLKRQMSKLLYRFVRRQSAAFDL
jgi:hypothetical protein